MAPAKARAAASDRNMRFTETMGSSLLVSNRTAIPAAKDAPPEATLEGVLTRILTKYTIAHF
jgi:hypothetical protein